MKTTINNMRDKPGIGQRVRVAERVFTVTGCAMVGERLRWVWVKDERGERRLEGNELERAELLED